MPGRAQPCSPDERSEIRDLFAAVPGLRFAYPGYEEAVIPGRTEGANPESRRTSRIALWIPGSRPFGRAPE